MSGLHRGDDSAKEDLPGLQVLFLLRITVCLFVCLFVCLERNTKEIYPPKLLSVVCCKSREVSTSI